MANEDFKKPTVKRLNELNKLLKLTFWLPEELKSYLFMWTNGRTSYYRYLYADEVALLIDTLIQLFKIVPSRRRIIAYIINLCVSHEFVYGNTVEDFLMNQAKIDKYVLQHCRIKKRLIDQNAKELIQTSKLFEKLFFGKKPKVSVIEYYESLGWRDYSLIQV